MICQKCGKQINNDYKLCPYCGTPVQQFVNTGQFQPNNQAPHNNPYNYGSPQLPQSGSYNYGNQRQFVQQPKENKSLGIIALTLGIAGAILSCFFVGIFPAIAAVVTGIIGIVKNNGKGLSIAGLVCGMVGIIIFSIFLFSDDPTETGSVSDTQEQSEIVSEPQEEPQDNHKDNNDTEIEANKTPKKEEQKSTEKSEKKKRKEFIDSCQEFDYKKIARNPDDYIGQNFKVTVQIYSVSTGSWLTEGYMKAYTDDGSGYYFDNMIYIFDDQDENSSYHVNVLEDDIITVYGTFEGMADSKNALNGEKSKDVALHMKYAELVSE